MPLIRPTFRLSTDPDIRQLQEAFRRYLPIDTPDVRWSGGKNGVFATLARPAPRGTGAGITFDYQVTIRTVDGAPHVILGPGQREIIGSPWITDADEVDLGAVVDGATIRRVYTYSTDATPGSWGPWVYSTTPIVQDALGFTWPIATTYANRPVQYHRVGMISILDVKVCQDCVP